MQAASLEVLEKANVPAPQARAIVQAIEIELAGAKDTLASKHDVLLLRHELHQELSTLQLRTEGLRTEIHAAAASQLRHIYGALLGQMTVLLGAAYFFVTHMVR
jgi:hypothetical protein